MVQTWGIKYGIHKAKVSTTTILLKMQWYPKLDTCTLKTAWTAKHYNVSTRPVHLHHHKLPATRKAAIVHMGVSVLTLLDY